VLLVEAIEKSANVALFAKHAISYMDGTIIASHDGPSARMDFRVPPTGHSMNVNLGESEVKLSFAAKFTQSGRDRFWRTKRTSRWYQGLSA
jgi:hypothetical protein